MIFFTKKQAYPVKQVCAIWLKINYKLKIKSRLIHADIIVRTIFRSVKMEFGKKRPVQQIKQTDQKKAPIQPKTEANVKGLSLDEYIAQHINHHIGAPVQICWKGLSADFLNPGNRSRDSALSDYTMALFGDKHVVFYTNPAKSDVFRYIIVV